MTKLVSISGSRAGVSMTSDKLIKNLSFFFFFSSGEGRTRVSFLSRARGGVYETHLCVCACARARVCVCVCVCVVSHIHMSLSTSIEG